MDKVEVNGRNEAPVYKYLKEKQGGFLGSDIKCTCMVVVVQYVRQRARRFLGSIVDSRSSTPHPPQHNDNDRELLQVPDQGRAAHQALRPPGRALRLRQGHRGGAQVIDWFGKQQLGATAAGVSGWQGGDQEKKWASSNEARVCLFWCSRTGAMPSFE